MVSAGVLLQQMFCSGIAPIAVGKQDFDLLYIDDHIERGLVISQRKLAACTCRSRTKTCRQAVQVI